MSAEQLNRLEQILYSIEKETGKLFTLTLHDMHDRTDTVIGGLEERNCKWQVVMNTHRKKKFSIDNTVFPMEIEIQRLNGVYDTYTDIKKALNKIRVDLALEMKSILSYRVKDDKFFVKCLCGKELQVKDNMNLYCYCEKQKDTIFHGYVQHILTDLYVKDGLIVLLGIEGRIYDYFGKVLPVIL